MELLLLLAVLAGVFVLLAFWHFPADWLFQTNKEALAKSENHLVRARHCLVYTLIYVPLLLLLRTRMGYYGPELDLGYQFWASLAILWTTHFVIDTYIPVMLWAKYLRRAPQFKDVVKPITFTKEQLEQLFAGKLPMTANPPRTWSDHEVDRITYASDKEAFRAFFMTPVGAILCITMDQLFHIACLWPVAWLMAN